MFDLHRELMSDELRTSAYREAIRRVVRPGDVVIDIGCGPGILSFFACEAGARRVYAIEQQHTADAASLLARHLGVDDVLQVIHRRSTETELPERADVLITETLGAFGLEERMLGSVIDARKRLLKDDARIIPEQLSLLAVPVEAANAYARHVDWWRAPKFGFDLSPVRVFASNTIYTADIYPANLLSSPAELINLDFRTIEEPAAAGEHSFVVTRAGVLHGFAGWFSTMLTSGITLCNEPTSQLHWDQAFLPLEQPVEVSAGTRIDLRLESHDGTAWRWRGVIHSSTEIAFDQTTWFAAPPCRNS